MTPTEAFNKYKEPGTMSLEDIGVYDSELYTSTVSALKHYAQEKVEQALELAAGKATLHIERDGKQVLKGNYTYFADDMDHVEIDKSSLLSLLPELVNQINKEI